MFGRIRKHLTFANVAVTAALVFAMGGGAYAAQKYVITSTKQIKPSVLKELKKAGPAGPVGPAGPAGAKGANGQPGERGLPGEKGSNGANGTSAETTTFNGSKGLCSAGGIEVKSASPTVNVCNGKEGKEGKEGSPWTVDGTLPKGKSETGTWSTIYTATAAGQASSSVVSVPIPLKTAPEAFYIGKNKELAGEVNEAAAIHEGKCKGSNLQPEAAEGMLCVFTEAENNVTEYLFDGVFPVRILEATVAGTIVANSSVAAGQAIAFGRWVVTGN